MYTHDMTKKNKKSLVDLNTKKIVDFLSKEENLHYEKVLDIDPKELAEKLEDVIVVDVRQPDEYSGELGHIPEAKFLVLDFLEENLHQLPKDKTLVFVCRSGGRSAKACYLASQNGFTNIFNMKGGMLLWNELHLPTEV